MTFGELLGSRCGSEILKYGRVLRSRRLAARVGLRKSHGPRLDDLGAIDFASARREPLLG